MTFCASIAASHAHPKTQVRFKISLVSEKELSCQNKADIGQSDSFTKKIHFIYALLKAMEPIQNSKLSEYMLCILDIFL